MKTFASLAFLFTAQFVVAQKHLVNYSLIDRDVMNIESSSPAELAQKLTASYKSDLEKTRAIFSWIAQHISYEYQSKKPNVKNTKHPVSDLTNYEADTSTTLTPLNELVAKDVLKKGTALCYGYSRLFKCLCDYAGVPCEIINGYARGDFNRVGNNFHTNHSWNAVQLDSTWYLVDVTWASGYFTYSSNEFIKHFDDQYFLTSPAQFALDHFPDDLKWSLLEQPPTIGEFQNSPYKSRYFIKYNIVSYWPKEGVIRASVGDTINLHIETNLSLDRNIGGGSIDDTLAFSSLANAVYCKPLNNDKSNNINYSYVVQSPDAQWLQLVYNDDMILRYKLDISSKRQK
ncbi:MAG: transglutaminase domain-containing protein [Chitinophagales bacterium]